MRASAPTARSISGASCTCSRVSSVTLNSWRLGMSRKSVKKNPPSESMPPEDEIADMIEQADGGGNGTALATEADEQTQLGEEPAQVQLTIKGSDKSARAAATRFGGEQVKPSVMTPPNDPEPPDDDPVPALLSDGRNMVLVTRQKPRTIEAPDGEEIPTNMRLPGKYECPTNKAEIEELVFGQHGGSKYKCTIHP